MGALPSRETHSRGLYSHRHGRNRRSELILLPLTREFFPDPHCPLFAHLHAARQRRTAKYYYRAVRPIGASPDSDFGCATTAHALAMDRSDFSAGGFASAFCDTPDGLYRVLVEETELCVCDTDAELRARYAATLQPDGAHSGLGEGHAYAAGCADARAYWGGRDAHTRRNARGAHVTSPAAYHLRPIPCAILSRSDTHRPPPRDGAEFLGSAVKVLGMFGLLPTTVEVGAGEHAALAHLLKAAMFVDKDVGDQILGNVLMLAVHMYVRQCLEAQLRAPYIPMIPFILRAPISNVPILQFLREMRVRLQPLLDAGTARSSSSSNNNNNNNNTNQTNSSGNNNNNGAGGGGNPARGAASGQNGAGSNASGDSGDFPDNQQQQQQQQTRPDPDAYLFEEDVPCVTSPSKLFAKPSEIRWPRLSKSHNTNPSGSLPILMLSGVNVLSAPLPSAASLSSTRHIRVPLWAKEESHGGLPNPTRAAMRLERRRRRFRIWVEDGRLCVWASAAYARRGCLLLAPQLNTMVDANLLPLPRAWGYRGLLRSAQIVPTPRHANDIIVVGCDMPLVGLFQGDILRCSTAQETAARCASPSEEGNVPRRRSVAPLPSPMKEKGHAPPTMPPNPTTDAPQGQQTTPTTSTPPLCTPTSKRSPTPIQDKAQTVSIATAHSTASPTGASPNYTSHHPSNVLLQTPEEAPTGAFWVLVPNDREDTAFYSPDARRRRQSETSASEAERRINLEDILLSWVKAISIQLRDTAEEDAAWVRNPKTGALLHIDRYLIRRVEHDGVRYFVGVAPRFLGEKRRTERTHSETEMPKEREVVGSGSEAEAGDRAAMAQLLSAPSHMLEGGEGEIEP